MIRIGQLTDTFLPVVDGVGRVAVAYARTLSRMGHEVTVITPRQEKELRDAPYTLADFNSIPVPGKKQYRVGQAFLDPQYRKKIQAEPLDILHAHSPFSAGEEALRLAKRWGVPLVSTFHSKYYDDFLKATRSELLARTGVRIVLNFYRQCDEVWAVGDATADVLRSYGYEGPIEIMPNGVSMRKANPEAAAEVSAKWGLGEDPLILFVGQMDYKKNILTVLEAAALLRQSGARFRLLLAGKGADYKEIEKKIQELGLQDCAMLIGHVTSSRELIGLYTRAALFAFPSLYDSAPMVVREAAVIGTPSVMVRGSSAAEIVRDGENGYLCENTPEDLCRVMQAVLQDPAAAEAVGQNARETIPVPWERILGHAVERYERLIALGKEGQLKRKPHS